MIFMIGVYKHEGKGKIIGFRLFDTDTGDSMDATYNSVYNAIKNKEVKVENLYLDNEMDALRESGGMLHTYVIIMGNEVYHNRVMTIVGIEGANNIDDIGEIQDISNIPDNVRVVCVDANGIAYKLSGESIKRYRIAFTNEYVKNNKDIINNSIKIKKDRLESDEDIKNYKRKCSLLGLEVPVIKDIKGKKVVIVADKEVKNIHIPSFVDYIGPNAFECSEKLENVIIHEGVKRIGNYAFYMCKSLEHIQIPESIDWIGMGAFYRTGIESITLNSRIDTITDSMLSMCDKLKNMIIPSNIKYIGNRAFSYCDSLRYMIIPETVERIGEGIFNMSAVRKVNIEARLREIPKKMFNGCNQLEEVIIPDSVEVIGDLAFEHCYNLKKIHISGHNGDVGSIILPTGLKAIGDDAFEDCESIKKVIMHDEVREIGRYAFNNCVDLEYIRMSKAITYIGVEAFGNCMSLRSIEIYKNVPEIYDNTFANCKSLVSVRMYNRNMKISSNAFDGCINLKNIQIIDDSTGQVVEEIDINDIHGGDLC